MIEWSFHFDAPPSFRDGATPAACTTQHCLSIAIHYGQILGWRVRCSRCSNSCVPSPFSRFTTARAAHSPSSRRRRRNLDSPLLTSILVHPFIPSPRSPFDITRVTVIDPVKPLGPLFLASYHSVALITAHQTPSIHLLAQGKQIGDPRPPIPPIPHYFDGTSDLTTLQCCSALLFSPPSSPSRQHPPLPSRRSRGPASISTTMLGSGSTSRESHTSLRERSDLLPRPMMPSTYEAADFA
jgi:hypothetical protein